MAVAAAQRRGVAMADAVELAGVRPAAPAVLVEAPAEDPAVPGQTPGVRVDLRERLVHGRGLADVDAPHLLRPPDEVHVCIAPARDHEPAAQVDLLAAAHVL